ncbi:MAG TPA: PAS domain S-box protein [Xanthobacteraceae bacterium]|nr:PAS domain S-box protein [Xanthobacteraceae bacterium]
MKPRSFESLLLSVLDTAVDGIIIIDEHGRISVYNQACERLFGYKAAEALGQSVRLIMPPEFSLHHDRYVADYLSSGRRKIIGIGREVKAQHRDGTVFPVELSVGEAMTSEGRRFIGIIHDLRQRYANEERLNQLQASMLHMARVSTMDEMGAALAHELNQPLTALILYLQAMERACARPDLPSLIPENVLAVLRKAVREAERAGNIIQRMRQFVEKRSSQRRLVEINPLVQDALELTQFGTRPGSTRIKCDLEANLPQVLVDPVQIQQILVNLARNALEAVKGRPEAEISITTCRTEKRIAIRVEDNGPGIRAEAIPDLFKAFASSKSHGLGLGLAISKTIAQSHGGTLEVDPGGKGRGARFTLSLPLTAPDVEGNGDEPK